MFTIITPMFTIDPTLAFVTTAVAFVLALFTHLSPSSIRTALAILAIGMITGDVAPLTAIPSVIAGFLVFALTFLVPLSFGRAIKRVANSITYSTTSLLSLLDAGRKTAK